MAEQTVHGKVSWGIGWFESVPEGAVILDVLRDGAAASAGLSRDDIISAVDGAPVRNAADLSEKIRISRPYVPVAIVAQRFGARLEKKLLPTGALRLEIKDVDRSFSVPGIPRTTVAPPASALEALDDINVLENVIFDRKSGQIAVIGRYDPKYSTSSIPYLDLLKTALKYPEPILNLESEGDIKTDFIGNVPAIKLLFGLPAAEQERQDLIREMAAEYGISRGEYVRLYNFAYFEARHAPAPDDIRRILVKALRHLGWNEVARAHEHLASGKPDDSWQALRLLGKEKWAREILADESYDTQQTEIALRILVGVSLLGKLQSQEISWNDTKFYISNALEERPADLFEPILTKLYQFAAVWLEDQSDLGKRAPIVWKVLIKKVGVGQAAAQIIEGGSARTVRIDPRNLDGRSRLARIMYEADYAGKTFLVRPDLFDGIPGHVTWGEYMSRKSKGLPPAALQTSGMTGEFWFEPKRVEIQISADRSVITFGAAEIVFSSKLEPGSEAAKIKELTDFYKDWSRHVTDHYELYAQRMPIFHTLREAAKMVALARWLRQNKISVDLSRVQQERWENPEKVPAIWRWSPFYWKDELRTGGGATGGVGFHRSGWTSYGPASKTVETKVPDQLVLSSELGKTAAHAASIGDLEKARHYAELSAQALTGHVTRGQLARQNIPLPAARPGPVSPARVQLQKELLKETGRQISALAQNPSNAQAAANLGRITNVYDQVRSKPATATEYLTKLQTRQLLPAVTTAPERPVPPSGGTRTEPDRSPGGAEPTWSFSSGDQAPVGGIVVGEAAYDCSTCYDALQRNILAKLPDRRMLGTYIDQSIGYYENCKRKAVGSCDAGDRLVRRLRACDQRRPNDSAYYVCIRNAICRDRQRVGPCTY